MKYFLTLFSICFLFSCKTIPQQERTGPNTIPQQTNIVKVEVLQNKRGLFDLDKQIQLGKNKDGKPISYENLWRKLAEGFTFEVPDNARIAQARDYFLKDPRHLEKISKRAEPFLYLIVEKIEKEHLPLEIALLPIVESSFDPHAYSNSGAVGLWQFMPETALRFGLKKNRWYEGRKDVYLSTDAALTYMKLVHKYLGNDWLRAFAAYNSGEGRVKRAIQYNEKENKPSDYWNLALPKETEDYVPKLLALVDILRHHKKYGITLPVLKNEQVLSYVKTKQPLALAYAGTLSNLSVAEIQLLNPALSKWATPPNGPDYLLIPTTNVPSFLKKLHKDTQGGFGHYMVRPGDSLSVIAKKHHISTKDLKKVNKLTTRLLKVGVILKVPRVNKARMAYVEAKAQHNTARYSKAKTRQIKIVYKVVEGDTLWDISRLYNVTVDDITKWNHLSIKKPLKVDSKIKIWQNAKVILVAVTPLKNTHIIKYRVVAGDSLSTISHSYHVSTKNLLKWNKINKNDVLRTGQILMIKAPLTGTSVSSNALKHTVVAGDSLWALSRFYGVLVTDIARWNNLNKQKSLKLGHVLLIKDKTLKNKIKVIYEVNSGNSLSEIAYKFNVQVSEVIKWNNLKDPKKLKIGEKLTLYVRKVY